MNMTWLDLTQRRKRSVQVSVPWDSLGPGFHHISGNSDQSDFSHCQYTHACKTHTIAGFAGFYLSECDTSPWGSHSAFHTLENWLILPDQVIHDESNPSWSHPDLPPHRERSKTVVSLSNQLALKHLGKLPDEEYQVKLEISVSRNTWQEFYFGLIYCKL